jgi:Wax ester synthase-like Acyl-CoA acyltransferase domain
VSDVSGLDAEGLPEKLGITDLLMHRGEANPRLRSGIMSLEILDDTPGWARYLNRFEDASRRLVRLRQKVVMPTLSTTAPRCVVDADFNLLFHVRRVHVPQPGTLREVLDLAEVMLLSPLEVSRPLWSATLIEGLAGGRAASLRHLSHAITDGVGSVETFSMFGQGVYAGYGDYRTKTASIGPQDSDIPAQGTLVLSRHCTRNDVDDALGESVGVSLRLSIRGDRGPPFSSCITLRHTMITSLTAMNDDIARLTATIVLSAVGSTVLTLATTLPTNSKIGQRLSSLSPLTTYQFP